MTGIVTVFGGSGFLGRAVVAALAPGWTVRVAARHPDRGIDPEVVTVSGVEVDIRDDELVGHAVAGAAAVVNAVGLYSERGGETFAAIHVEGAGRVARAASNAGVRRLVHVSGIGVDSGSPSAYVRARADGERRVREVFENVVIVRPSVLIGPDDALLGSLDAVTRLAPIIPLFGQGDIRLQPVFVHDVARAVHAVLEHASPLPIYELGGARTCTYRELVLLVLGHRRRRRLLAPFPLFAWDAIATAAALLPSPPLTPDQVELMRADNVVAAEGVGTFVDLGIPPGAVDELLDRCLS